MTAAARTSGRSVLAGLDALHRRVLGIGLLYADRKALEVGAVDDVLGEVTRRVRRRARTLAWFALPSVLLVTPVFCVGSDTISMELFGFCLPASMGWSTWVAVRCHRRLRALGRLRGAGELTDDQLRSALDPD